MINSAWDLPTDLEVGGKKYNIRTDYRVILDILSAFSDPELSDGEKSQVMFEILYEDYEQIPAENIQEALEKASWFIDCGMTFDDKPKPRMIDWEKDAPIIFPAVNKVAGRSVRGEKIHWWDFFGYFMEIEEGLFSQVLSIRQKKSKGKKLEKWEREFYQENKVICDLPKYRSEEEQEEVDYLIKLLDGK